MSKDYKELLIQFLEFNEADVVTASYAGESVRADRDWDPNPWGVE
jgi:hypothetical protein